MKIQTIEFGCGETGHFKITVPGSDIEEIKLTVRQQLIKYNDFIYHTTEDGNQKIKQFCKMNICNDCIIKFISNQIEKSLMEEILNTKDISTLRITLENGSQESYELPCLWQKENWLQEKHNVCQGAREYANSVELSFNFPQFSKRLL